MIALQSIARRELKAESWKLEAGSWKLGAES
jgi:hypothetical protein